MALGFTKTRSEFLVNTTTTLYQADPSVAGLTNGNYVIIWGAADQSDPLNETDDIIGQLYDFEGNAIGTEFLVNSYTTSFQIMPTVTALNNGSFVIVWASDGADGDGLGVFSQRYKANGTKAGDELQVNTFTENHQYAPTTSTLSDGGYVVTWHSEGQSGEIFAQIFTSKSVPVGNEFQVNTTATGYLLSSFDYRDNVAITAFDTGGFAVTWIKSSGGGVFGQRFNNSGDLVGVEFQIDTTVSHWQGASAVAALADGGFLVTWQANNGDVYDHEIYGQRFDSAGDATGAEFQVNTYTSNDQINPAAIGLADGGFVIAWGSRDQDGDRDGIFAQRYDAAGDMVGVETQINTYSTHHQKDVALASLADGGFVISWESAEQDGDQKGVYAQEFKAQYFGTSGNDRLVDTVGANWMDGGNGKDRLFGKGEADKLFGGKGNDFLSGGSGDDILKGQNGRDTLFGGAGKDTLTGGSKADIFVFRKTTDSSANNEADIIKDFETGIDRIDLSDIGGALNFIGASSFSTTAPEIRVTNVANGNTIVRVDTDGNGTVDMKIILEATEAISAGDFIL